MDDFDFDLRPRNVALAVAALIVLAYVVYWLPTAAAGFQQHPVAWLLLALIVVLRRQLRALVDAVAGALPERSFKLDIKGVKIELGEVRLPDVSDVGALPAPTLPSEWVLTDTVVLSEHAAQIQFDMRPLPPRSDAERAAHAAASAAFDALDEAVRVVAAPDQLRGRLRALAPHVAEAGFYEAARLSRLVEADAQLGEQVEAVRAAATAQPPALDPLDRPVLLAVGVGRTQAGRWADGLALLRPLVGVDPPYLPAGPAFLVCLYNDCVERLVVKPTGDITSTEFLAAFEREIAGWIRRLDQAAEAFDAQAWSQSYGISTENAVEVRRALWQQPGVIYALLAQNVADDARRAEFARASLARLKQAAVPIAGVEPDGFVLSNLALLQIRDGATDEARATLARLADPLADPIFTRTHAGLLASEGRLWDALRTVEGYPEARADSPGKAREFVYLQIYAAALAEEWDALAESSRRGLALGTLEKARAFADAPGRRAFFDEDPRVLFDLDESLGHLYLEEPGRDPQACEAFERLERRAAGVSARHAPLPERRCAWHASHARARVRAAREERLLLSPRTAERSLEAAHGRLRALITLLKTLALVSTDPGTRQRRRVQVRLQAVGVLLRFADEALAQQRHDWAKTAVQEDVPALLLELHGAWSWNDALRHADPRQGDGRLAANVEVFDAWQALLDARWRVTQDPDGEKAGTLEQVEERFRRAAAALRLKAAAQVELGRFLLVVALRGRADGLACLRRARDVLEDAAQSEARDARQVRAEALRLLAHAWSAAPAVEQRQKQAAKTA